MSILIESDFIEMFLAKNDCPIELCKARLFASLKVEIDSDETELRFIIGNSFIILNQILSNRSQSSVRITIPLW
ncbi:hypothetical protein CWB73_03530 [Pseudoalteromonas phenolica]|uniref:Uncharacterized protein n=1 Tax=Pseudoalteromonas phenolica TaxID=161398 RepID=A0A4Q7IPJ5_9GAMM|nr:hypothetical protein C1E23_11200 [Pseudoalteromonas phenolica]TMN93787.1 hypothetical protein CWB72_01000 [Pseudoalteromonas phenolica]TMP82910.1 hypothetical protein CWB73_03530 [Pseudoalteromonas phenolica]